MRLIKKSDEGLEKELERLKLETEVEGQRAQLEERKAVIHQLKATYGPGWKQQLGISKLTDLPTLRSFLANAKKGMQKESASITSSTRMPVRGGPDIKENKFV
jgi:hypothetical protein